VEARVEVDGLLQRSSLRLAVVGLGVLALLGLAAGYGMAARARPRASRIALDDSPSSAPVREPVRRLAVHVAGAVNQPGVYRMAEGERVDDALRAAGGPKPDADLDAVNLAARVRDGDKVLIPSKNAVAGAGASGGGAGARVNLNTASEAELDALPGIGPSLAQRILSYRQEHGGFRLVKDLGKVPGIGPRKLADLQERVTV
jgi:competence protein ComEA